MEKKPFNWRATIEENVRTGFTELLILQILSERDLYGYELKKAIIERTNGAFSFTESSLYVPLMRMMSRDLISSRKEIVTGKRFRTYYHIEEAGEKYLAYGKEQCETVFAGIQNLFLGAGDEIGHQ